MSDDNNRDLSRREFVTGDGIEFGFGCGFRRRCSPPAKNAEGRRIGPQYWGKFPKHARRELKRLQELDRAAVDSGREPNYSARAGLHGQTRDGTQGLRV